MPHVSQNAVMGGVALLCGLVLIPIVVERAPQCVCRYAGRGQVPKRLVQRSSAQTKLALSGKRPQFTIVVGIARDRQDAGDRGIAIPDQDFLAGPDLIEIETEAILQLSDADASHTWP